MFATPFLLERTVAASRPDADSRWDYALPLWGAVAVGLGGLGLLVGLGSGFAGDSLAGSAALITVIEAGLVVIAVAFVLLSS